MGLIGFIIDNMDRESAYRLGNIAWEYTTLGRAYNAIYYGITYGWRYRENIKNKIYKEWDEHNITPKIKNCIYDYVPQITYPTLNAEKII